MIRIGIIGATGYTGLELLRWLRRHPAAEIAWLTSESSAGQQLGDVFAAPPETAQQALIPWEQADLSGADVVFCCLPHVAAQGPVAAARRSGARVIDLSADYRLHDPASYETWYGHPHHETDLLRDAVYGLPELHREAIAQAELVANPGCYPTSVILGLAPLARRGWLSGTVIADSKSGVSGAGRKPSLKTHFVEANENFSPYSIGRTHRHIAEMEQELAQLDTGNDWQLIFSPHLLPVTRGILSTLYVNLPQRVDGAELRALYSDTYGAEPFTFLLPEGQVATLAHTTNSNYCAIGLTQVPESLTLIVTVSIDNLVKGASGQAIQNMNILFGLDERMGLL